MSDIRWEKKNKWGRQILEQQEVERIAEDTQKTMGALKTVVESNLFDMYAPYLEETMPAYSIDTLLRQRHFLAQLLHESGGFRFVIENLNYSAEALTRTWPRIFPPEIAAQFARQPERIANRAYGNRMGNRGETSGDGWRFIGRGLIQTTGRYNYQRASLDIFNDVRLLTSPELLEQPRYAVESACVFWQNNNLNRTADQDNFELLTRLINGGLNGLSDRQRYFNLLAS